MVSKQVYTNPPVFLELEVSHVCNLNCKYCYERDAVDPKNTDTYFLDYKAAKERILEFYNSYKQLAEKAEQGKVRVEFFGGEPLLAMKTIKQVLKDDSLAEIADYSVITNTTIYDDEFAELAVKRNVNIEFSIDAPRIQNKYRIWRFNKKNPGTWEHVWATFKKYITYFSKYNYKTYRVRTSIVEEDQYDEVIMFVLYLLLNDISVTLNIIPLDKAKIREKMMAMFQNVRNFINIDKKLPMFTAAKHPRFDSIDCLHCISSGCEDSLMPGKYVPCFERVNSGVFDREDVIIRYVNFTRTKFRRGEDVTGNSIITNR